MTILRVQHALAHTNGLGKDLFVNTFYFNALSDSSADFPALALAVNTFYTADPPTTALALSTYLSGLADGSTGVTKIYNMSHAEPRVPVYTLPVGGATFGTTGGNLPSEVAACLSYEGTGGTDVPIRRRRGRVYIGPLMQTANASTSASIEATVASAVQDSITQCAQMMRTAALAAGATWAVYSPTNNAAYPIYKVWCDNAFDIQRRRGIKPSARTTLTIV